MSNIIEMHQIRALGLNSLNRGEDGQVKSVNKGGRLRTRLSSQSLKRAYEDAMEGDVVRTRFLANILMDRYQKEHPNETEDVYADMKTVFMTLTGCKKYFGDEEPKSKNKKAKGSNDDNAEEKKATLSPYSPAEIAAIYHYAMQLVESAAKETKNKEEAQMAKALEEVKKGKLPAKTKKELQDMVKYAGPGLMLCINGRMAPIGPGYDMQSSTHFSHAYSIDGNYKETDYFSAIDTWLRDINEPGSGHLDHSSFAANTIYQYANLDPVQTLQNMINSILSNPNKPAEKKRKEVEIAAKVVCDGVISYLEKINRVLPSGKQNSMATFPNASIISCTFVKDGYPCTMDSVFDAVIKNNSGTIVEASDRVLDFLRDIRYHQNYCVDQLHGDSAVLRHYEEIAKASDEELDRMKHPAEDREIVANVLPVNQFDKTLQKIREEIEAVFQEYIDNLEF